VGEVAVYGGGGEEVLHARDDGVGGAAGESGADEEGEGECELGEEGVRWRRGLPGDWVVAFDLLHFEGVGDVRVGGGFMMLGGGFVLGVVGGGVVAMVAEALGGVAVTFVSFCCVGGRPCKSLAAL
jgi:hypothetical protein